MASEADFPYIDFSQLEKDMFSAHENPSLKKGFKEDTLLIIEDISQRPKRVRSQIAEAGVRVLEKAYFDPYLCRNLAVTAERALTLDSIQDDILILGEDLDGPLHANGTFTGITFVQIAQFNFEPVVGMEMGEFQIISGERPNTLSRRLLIPIPDVVDYQFN